MLYVDLDGVLADFDKGYEQLFGERPQRQWDQEAERWARIAAKGDFYLHLPMMEDASLLWQHVSKYNPTILTGVPSSVLDAVWQKKDWCNYHLGSRVPVLTCASVDKSKFCFPGDIIVDDWAKYQDLWLQRGGKWILHVSAVDSIQKLKEYGIT